MNYRHVFHAGNFSDVIKHIALVAILQHLARKATAFCVIDTHAGDGIYDLRGTEAARTGEASGGIGRLNDLRGMPTLPETLRTYLDCVNQEGEGRYPGSARIAARLLRPQDRLIAVERYPESARALRNSLANFPNARVVEADGYERLLALVPPRERRGVILIDPPFEADDEFARLAVNLARANRRFATGIYVIWYPVKSRAAANAFCGEISAYAIAPKLRLEIDVGRDPETDKERLSASGLLVVNPPYRFDEEMRSIASILAQRLGHAERDPAKLTVVSSSD